MLDVYKANRRETEEPVFPSQAHDFAGSELVITEALRTPDITKQSLLCSKFLLFQPENSLLPILVFTCFLKTRIEAWRHEARQTGHWSPRPPSSGHTLSSLCTCGPGAPAGPHAPRGPVGRNPAVCVDFYGKVCRTRSLWRSNDSGGVFVQGASRPFCLSVPVTCSSPCPISGHPRLPPGSWRPPGKRLLNWRVASYQNNRA